DGRIRSQHRFAFRSRHRLEQHDTRGRLADNQNVVSNLSQFAGVANGSFNINGVSIDVDASHDTLQSLIAKINASAAGVTAGYDAGTDRLVLTGVERTPRYSIRESPCAPA